MKLINQGAEAKIYSCRFEEYFGTDSKGDLIIKERISKGYRIRELDERIVLQRTLSEAKLLHEAKMAGIPTPVIYFIDKRKHALVMEKVGGQRVKEELVGSPKESMGLIEAVGRSVGLMHGNNIIHGDLTTSNMIHRGDEVVFIDFGLGEFSSEVEKQAVDAHLLKQALKSTHFDFWEEYWEAFKQTYCRTYRKGREVLERIGDIELRGRYIERGE
ncbi:MAG: Kae1-associated serine/threonine protein kinase [Candidatus Methanofastidiosa archaeon]|nr:Kae1-associated serine/threonine protein kinase [Candidatus Methanofastidiosa archaeon]